MKIRGQISEIYEDSCMGTRQRVISNGKDEKKKRVRNEDLEFYFFFNMWGLGLLRDIYIKMSSEK